MHTNGSEAVSAGKQKILYLPISVKTGNLESSMNMV